MSVLSNAITGFRNLISINEKFQASLCEHKKMLLQNNILHNSALGISSNKYGDKEIIVSLTSYGKRIHEVALTIESLMEQTILPNRIILWLSNKEKNIPTALKQLEKRGLEIEFCNDIGSYKKLLPALKKFANAIIITVDDDVYYEYDLLENLIVANKKFPNDILAHRMHRMTLNQEKDVMPYFAWEHCVKDFEPSFLNFAVGVGGVLYPPDSFDESVFDESVFMNICRYGDDIWFKAMSILKNRKTRSVFSHSPKGEDYYENNLLNSTGLFSMNTTGKNLNDIQLNAVFSKYGIKDIIKSVES